MKQLISTALIHLLVFAYQMAFVQTSGTGTSGQTEPQTQSGSQNQQTGETVAPDITGRPAGSPGVGESPRDFRGNTAPRDFTDRSPTPWFSDPGARQQLGLTDEQYLQLSERYRTAWDRYNRGRTGLSNDLTDARRQARLRALREQFDNDFSGARNNALRDERIRNRYDQLEYQYRSYGSFENPVIRQRLSLTPQQRRELNRFGTMWNQEMGRIAELSSTNPEAALQRYREVQAESRERLGSVFTPQQQRQWSEVIGDPYDFSYDTYFPREQTARNPAPERTPNSVVPPR